MKLVCQLLDMKDLSHLPEMKTKAKLCPQRSLSNTTYNVLSGRPANTASHDHVQLPATVEG